MKKTNSENIILDKNDIFPSSTINLCKGIKLGDIIISIVYFCLLFIFSIPISRFVLQLKPFKILVPWSCVCLLYRTFIRKTSPMDVVLFVYFTIHSSEKQPPSSCYDCLLTLSYIRPKNTPHGVVLLVKFIVHLSEKYCYLYLHTQTSPLCSTKSYSDFFILQ